MLPSPPKGRWKRHVSRPRLHLDADVSIKALQSALVACGHDVTQTPNEWMALDASDETQLLGATAHGRFRGLLAPVQRP